MEGKDEIRSWEGNEFNKFQLKVYIGVVRGIQRWEATNSILLSMGGGMGNIPFLL